MPYVGNGRTVEEDYSNFNVVTGKCAITGKPCGQFKKESANQHRITVADTVVAEEKQYKFTTPRCCLPPIE